MTYMYNLYVYVRRGRPVCIKALQEYTQHIQGAGALGRAGRRCWFGRSLFAGWSESANRKNRWYATLPTSNVASERVFGVVRGLEDDQRRRASEETVTIETLARCNSWLVDVVRAKHGSL